MTSDDDLRQWWSTAHEYGIPGEWPEGGLPLDDVSPVTQFWATGNRYVGLCHPDEQVVLRAAQDTIPMGYKSLIVWQKVAVAFPDGKIVEWTVLPVPDEHWKYDNSVPGYDVFPQLGGRERVPGYPGSWPATDAGLRDAIAMAARAAAVVDAPVPVGRIREWIDWH